MSDPQITPEVIAKHGITPDEYARIQQILGRDPTADETAKWSAYLVDAVVRDMQAFIEASPDTLFVFAAGNDGTDNDSVATAPANDKGDNSIAVAATLTG